MTGLEDRPETDLRLANALARIHAAAFEGAGRAWRGPEILALMDEPAVSLFLTHREDGAGDLAPVCFALCRVAAGEAELLTIAVAPDAMRQGLGRATLDACISRATSDGAERLFLEVGAGNLAARALYAQRGFRECGRRVGYYRLPDGTRADAVIMERRLP